MKASKFSMDTWFTGGDFASEAMGQIQTAVRRRFLIICFSLFDVILSLFGAVASLCFTWNVSNPGLVLIWIGGLAVHVTLRPIHGSLLDDFRTTET